MATIVLIHGIAQEQQGANSLEQNWLPALADGVIAAGYPQLADRIWASGRPSDISTRMVFYGDLFLTPGTMGPDDSIPSSGEQRDLAEQLAEEWLARAVDRDHPDRRAAATQLSYLDPAGKEEQGPLREAQRSALNGLAKLRWFAPLGMAFAGTFVNQTLKQVTAYLTDEQIRAEIQHRVADNIDADTKVLIGHSLGSVIAYEAAHRLSHPLPLLLTLGSPLGLRTVVYDKVDPPPSYPPQVKRWVNIADRNDLVAAVPDLQPAFDQVPPGARFDGDWTVDNGAKPHEALFYLRKEETGRPVAEALASTRGAT